MKMPLLPTLPLPFPLSDDLDWVMDLMLEMMLEDHPWIYILAKCLLQMISGL